ncbi:hypothetical protein [Hyphococcus luteus]|uniref:Uncharacterized protein n=1 Tax=Hyphococcus luteus TaxID=2058213 RepID=A0A2S7K316_9PROT|nr:hypothetical protein [Marinicaulis flavus]PQA86893.1 hypothetical protein CW354_15590 [Marinicaulis flavus]
MNKAIRIEQHSGLGMLWFLGWLFSLGFLKMSFWKGLLALFVWPYFLGAHFEKAAEPHAGAPAGLEQPQSERD